MERLAKRIAGAGLCSRRDAEKLILAGRVKVDGIVVSSPAFNVDLHNKVSVDDREIMEKSKPRLWGFYKPVGLITTHKDPQGRPTVFGSLPSKMPRVISVGRLDLNSEGVLLLTTDTRISRYAESPKTGWPRYYKVRVFGEVNPERLANLVHGVTIDGIHYGRIDVEIDRQSGRNAWLFVTLYEGKNREIREVMRYLGLQVNRLIRVAYGPFELYDKRPGDLWEIPYSEFSKHFPDFKEDTPQKEDIIQASEKKVLRHRGSKPKRIH